MIPVLLILAAAYWLAAPDPATAGARTAAGTGIRAAGAGARQHWASGRKDRELSRTARRDRWWKAGGLRRFLLRGEHGAVITGKAAKGAAKLTAAAARPVPAAVKRGWVQGMDRHQQRAGNRPAGLALDPPWWHRGQAQVQPADPQVQVEGTGREQVQVQAGEQSGNSPEVQAEGQDDAALIPADLRCQRCDIGRRRYTYNGIRVCGPCSAELDRQEAGRPGDPEQQPIKTDPDPTDIWQDPPLPEEEVFFTGYYEDGMARGVRYVTDWMGRKKEIEVILPEIPPDPTDQPGGTTPSGTPNQAPTTESREPHCANCGKRLEYNLRTARPRGVPVRDDPDSMWCPECARSQPADPPAGTSPAGTPSTTAIPTQGDPVSVNVPSEINDLTTLHGFAQAVIEDAEENGPGSTYAQAAASISEYFGRDFGREVNATASAFEEAAAAFNQAWQQMVEAADAMKTESLAAIGG